MDAVKNFIVSEYFTHLHAHHEVHGFQMQVSAAATQKFNVNITSTYVARLINQFKSCKLVLKSSRGRVPIDSERHKSAVLAAISADPTASVRRIAAETRVSKSTIHKILQANGYKAFKPSEVQSLSYSAMNDRLDFCKDCLARYADPRLIWFSDEKIFCLKRRTNHQNTSFWSKRRSQNFVNK